MLLVKPHAPSDELAGANEIGHWGTFRAWSRVHDDIMACLGISSSKRYVQQLLLRAVLGHLATGSGADGYVRPAQRFGSMPRADHPWSGVEATVMRS